MSPRTELRILHALRALRGGLTGAQVSVLSGVGRWTGGVYVHLGRLVEEGVVSSSKGVGDNGLPRRYYALTEAGWDRLRDLYREFL